MKIATFNINNVNRRLPNLLAWLETAQPDVVCLQELKAAQNAFPLAAIRAAGYGAAWRGQQTWNGVAILARGAEPVVTLEALPGDPRDSQSRYIEAGVAKTVRQHYRVAYRWTDGGLFRGKSVRLTGLRRG